MQAIARGSAVSVNHRYNKSIENPMQIESKPSSDRPARKWIRLRRLADARFVIEHHDIAKDGFESDTGIMVLGHDGHDMRRLMVDMLAKEAVNEIIDATDSSLIHRAESVARLKTLSPALEEHKREGYVIPASLERSSPQSPPTPAPIPKVGQRKDLSAVEKRRLSELLYSKKAHIITSNDELGFLLFDYLIPEGVWIHVSVLTTANMGIAFPCRHDNKGNPVKPLDGATAELASKFTLTFVP